MFREINTNKKSYALFTILNFTFILFAYLIVFYIISEISPVIKLSEGFTDSNLYTYNVDLKKYYNEEDYTKSDLYSFDYIDDNGESNYIIYMNSNAAKSGIIYPNEQAFINIDLSNLEKDKIYSLNDNSSYECIKIKQYDKINTKFVNLYLHYDLVCISDDYFLTNEASVVVYKRITNHYTNNISDESFVASGSYIKSNILNNIEGYKNLLVVFTLLPIFFSILSFINIINLFIRKEKDNITIKLVYYSNKIRLSLEYTIRYSIFIALTNIVAIILSSLIFNLFSLNTVLFAILLSTIFEIICCYLIILINITILNKRMDFGEDLC